MKGEAPISSIYKRGKQDQQDVDWEAWGRIERLRRNAWLDTGVLAFKIEDLPEDVQGQMQQWAEEIYGAREA